MTSLRFLQRMRGCLAAALILLASPALAGPILRVIDGDTYIIAAPWLPPELGKTISLRVMGIDTPEHGARAKCKAEADLADKATAAAKDMIRKAKVTTVTLSRWDKYGGRIDGVSLSVIFYPHAQCRPAQSCLLS